MQSRIGREDSTIRKMNLMTASNQWATRPADERFETLADLRASVHGRRLRSRSVDLDLPRVSVGSNDDVIEINSAIAPSQPTHWAFGQLAGLVGAPANYLRSLPIPIVRQALNHGIVNSTKGAVKFMTLSDPDGGDATLQAVTSTTYGRIWDADVVDAVGRIVERTNGKFFNPKAYAVDTTKGQGFRGIDTSVEPKGSGLYASDRDVFVFMIDGGSLLDAGPRAKLNRGFIVWNSEVGAKTFGLMTFMFNQVCGNHIIWGAQNVNTLLIRHTRGAPTRFDNEATPALLEYANASAQSELSTIRRAQDYLLPKDADKFDQLVAPFKFTKLELKEGREAALREEGDCRTLWHLVQGLTAFARGYDYVDARVDLERRAGKLLDLVSQ